MPRRALTAALLVVLAGLVPLAHASPPDPTWIAGLYDDDYDDVFIGVTSGVGITERRLPTIARPALGWSWWSVHPRVAGMLCGIPAPAFIARAPPNT